MSQFPKTNAQSHFRPFPLLSRALLATIFACTAAARSGAPLDPHPAPPAAVTKAPLPPTPRQEEVSSKLHGVTVPDPYRWLEDPTAPETQAWVQAQSQYARAALSALPGRAELAERFEALLYRDSVSPPRQRGGRYFYERRYKDREKAILMVRERGGQERSLIDPHAMSDDGSVSLGDWFPSWDGSKVAYTKHENNADEATLFIRDVATGRDLPLDVIEGAKYAGPSWTPDNQGFYYEWLPVDASIPIADRPGRTELRYHRVGTAASRDVRVFPATYDPQTFLYGGVSRDGRWLTVGVQRGWNQTDLYVRDARQPLADAGESPLDPSQSTRARVDAQAARLGFRPLAVGLDAQFHATWWDGHFYIHTNLGAPRYRVLKTTPDRLEPDQWREVVAETPNKLSSMRIVGGRLALGYLENASSHLELRTLEGQPVRDVELPGLGSASGMVGNPDSDEAYFAYSSFTVPSQVYKTSVARGGAEIWSEVDIPLDTEKVVVEQVRYPSKDGTKISMFIVHNRGIARDGSHPTLLYGYGGFNISLTPSFSALAAVWLEHGGVYAVANLRGGGEYGESWHRAGMGANKQNVFDDYIAAARYLTEEGYTSADHLAIHGGSNGGLLVGAAMTQAPELFRAVVCGVPLLDMIRYHLFGSGKTWIAEYGSAEEKAQFETLLAYSPYHHVQRGVSYPDLLMMAADSDDRVDPMHARKFTAMVQWAMGASAGQRALFRLEENAGHGGGDMVKKRVASSVDILSFLLSRLTSSGH